MLDSWFWIWSVLALVLLVGEIFTAGFFMLPFGIGAIVAAGMSFLEIDPLWQTLTFIAISTAAFLLLRKVADRMTHEPPEKMGADRLIGKRGSVIEELTPNSPVGQIRVDREEWRADAPGAGIVPVGTEVIVDGIEGTHLVVRLAED